MAGSSALIELLRKKKAEKKAEKAIDWDACRSEWLDALRQLVRTLKQWLKPAIQEGLKVEDYSATITEDHLGTYEAPALRITGPDSRTVTVEAKACNVIGAKGRVDLSSGPKKAMLVRYGRSQWGIAVRNIRGLEKVELTQDTFSELLADLLE
jgi:hypothetical protein